MSASPFDEIPAISSFQDATNASAPSAGCVGWGHAAAPASAAHRPCAASRSTLQPSQPGHRPPHDRDERVVESVLGAIAARGEAENEEEVPVRETVKEGGVSP